MVEFDDFQDGNTEGANINVTDALDPTKKARVLTDEEGIDRLQTSANLDSGQLVPTITNKFRIQKNVGNINLPAGSPGAFVTLFSRSGTGLFFGFQAAFNNENVEIQLTLDGGIVFLLSLNDVRAFQFNDTSTTRTQMGGFLTTIGNTFDFSSKFAIPYETDLKIEVRATTPGAGKINTNWIVFGTEDS